MRVRSTLMVMGLLVLFFAGCSEDDRTIDFDMSYLIQIDQSTRAFEAERDITLASMDQDFQDRYDELDTVTVKKLTFTVEGWTTPATLNHAEVSIGRADDTVFTVIGTIEDLDMATYTGGGQALMETDNEDYLAELFMNFDTDLKLILTGEGSGVPLDFTVRIGLDMEGEY